MASAKKEDGLEDNLNIYEFIGGSNWWLVDDFECSGNGGSSLLLGPANSSASCFAYAFVNGGPGAIEFEWKKEDSLKSEFFDLIFYVEDSKQGIIKCQSLNELKKIHKYPIESGTHKLIWAYSVGNKMPISLDTINSCAWIDNINLYNLNFTKINSRFTIYAGDDIYDIMNILESSTDEIYIESGSNLQNILDILENFALNRSLKRTFLLSGRYEGPVEIRVPNITIKAESYGKAIIDGNNIDYNILINGTSNVCLENMIMQNSIYGICIENSSDCSILRNMVYFCSEVDNCGSGIYLNNCSSIELLYNSLNLVDPEPYLDRSYGIWLSNSNLSIIKFNNFVNTNYNYYIINSCDNSIYDKNLGNQEYIKKIRGENIYCNDWRRSL